MFKKCTKVDLWNLCRIQSDISISDLNFTMTRSLILNRQEKILENLSAQMREYLHTQKVNTRVILWRTYKKTIGEVQLQSRKEVLITRVTCIYSKEILSTHRPHSFNLKEKSLELLTCIRA